MSPPSTATDLVQAAAREIQSRWPRRPLAGIILGTGLGPLAERVQAEVVFEYRSLPGFVQSTALAHQGRLIAGTLGGAPVIALQGRVHYYEGYSFGQITHGTRVVAALGASVLIASNASGGINPQFASGDIMLITDHIDLMGYRNAMLPSTVGVSHADPVVATRSGWSESYDRQLLASATGIARRNGFACQQGVYVGVTGPNYETRAEYRAFRRIGGDVVGMSTIPEVVVARRLGLRVLALSVVTNVARPDAPVEVNANEVVDLAEQAGPRLQILLERLLADIHESAETAESRTEVRVEP